MALRSQGDAGRPRDLMHPGGSELDLDGLMPADAVLRAGTDRLRPDLTAAELERSSHHDRRHHRRSSEHGSDPDRRPAPGCPKWHHVPGQALRPAVSELDHRDRRRPFLDQAGDLVVILRAHASLPICIPRLARSLASPRAA